MDPGLEGGLKVLSGACQEAEVRYRRNQRVTVTGGINHNDANKTVGTRA